MPNPKNDAYEYNYEYVVIKENTEVQKDLIYKKINLNKFSSDTQILFKGLGDGQFADIKMDLENKKLTVNSLNTKPHVYFTDEYANIQIFDTKGNLVYEKSYIGNTSNPSNDTIDIEIGYTIKIKHREASSRLIFKSEILNNNEEFKNLDDGQTTYTITKYGLQKEGTTSEEQYEIYKRKLDKYIEKLKNEISEEKQKDTYSYFIQKNKLLSNILDLNEEDKEKYLNENETLIKGSQTNETDDTDKLYLETEYNRIEEKYISRVEKEITRQEFTNNLKTNGTIKIIKQNGEELGEKELVGTGMILQITKGQEKIELKIAVNGDVSGDGKVTAQDLSTINKAILKTIILEDEYKIAGDLDENEKITATDLSTINKMVLKML